MLTYVPFDHQTQQDQRITSGGGNPLEGRFGPVNVGTGERYASVMAGAALAVIGLSRRSFPGLLVAAIGGAFIFRGTTGHCAVYEEAEISTNLAGHSGVPGNHGTKVEKTIFINRSPQEIFRFWRNLENLPKFMDNVESVRALDSRRSHWVVKAPAGQRVEWDAEIVNEHPHEMISWQTLPGAHVQSAGTVRFNPAPDGQGTTLRVVLEFRPPGGSVGARIASLFNRNPGQQLEADLLRLKNAMERGDDMIAAG